MSAHVSKTSSATDEALWIPAGVAALKLGRNAGGLRRACEQRLQHEGLAKKIGGTWHVHAGFDPRLAARRHWRDVDLEHLAELDARGIAPKYIEIAKRRRDVIQALAAYYPAGRPTARQRRVMFCAQLRADGANDVPSVTQLYEWERMYATDGLRGLVPAFAFRAAAESGGACGEAALEYMDQLLNCGQRITVAAALAIARGESVRHGDDPRWRLGSYRAALLAVEKRRPKILKMLSDTGERAANAHCMPKLTRDTESISAGDEYVGDERTVDVWVRVLTSRGWRAVRPKLTAWMDMRSRVIVGWHLAPHADSSTILASLRFAIRDFGKPVTIRTDWGEDYKRIARHPKYKMFDGTKIGSILDELSIEVRKTAGPYQPWAKSIESFFNLMKSQLDTLHASFWGGCPSERHEDRVRWLRENMERLPTLDEFRDTLAAWLDIYHATPHGAADMFGKTPMQAMAAFRESPIRRESAAVLTHLFKTWTMPKLVRRDGVRHLGRWFGNGDARLVPMQGRRVVLAFDVADASRATVCELDRTPLFEIEALNVRGMSARELSERIREQKKIIRPFKNQAKSARDFILSKSPGELLRLRAAGAGITPSAEAPAEPPAATLRLRTDLEVALDAAGPAPSDVQPRLAVRSGTDADDLTLDDLLGPSMPCPRTVAGGADNEDDGFTLADLAGEILDG